MHRNLAPRKRGTPFTDLVIIEGFSRKEGHKVFECLVFLKTRDLVERKAEIFPIASTIRPYVKEDLL